MATFTLWHSYRHAETAILRQQMKWVTRGTILSVAPFTIFYIIPYLFGGVPGDGDEDLRAVAGVPAADLRLRHLPLPADGCGPDLQARHGLHHCRRRHHGSVFRRGRHGLGAVPPELPQRRADRTGGCHRRHRAAVRSVQELGAGDPRQVFLSQTLRLPQDADRVWPRSELRDRSRQDAQLDRRSAVAHAVGRSAGDLPVRSRSAGAVLLWPSRTASPTPANSDFDFLHVERPEWQAGHLFFDNTNQAVRETPSARDSHSPPGAELLHSLHRYESHDRGARSGQDRRKATSSPAKTCSCWKRWPATSASRCRTRACTSRWKRKPGSTSG